MCTSDTDRNRKRAIKTAYVYLWVSVFCLLFGAVYEYFSHGVFSYFMIYAFAFPLLLGVLLFFTLGRRGIKHYPAPILLGYHHCAVATLTVGSLVAGVLEIYGTSSTLIPIYFSVGAGLLIAEGISYLVQRFLYK